MVDRVRFNPLEWWWLDAPVAAALVGALAASSRPGTGVDLLGKLTLSDRRAVYTDILQLAVIFAGFGGVIFAIYLGMQSPGVRGIRKLVGRKFLRMWISALVMPWFCAVTIILCRVIDRGETGTVNAARWIAIGCVFVVLLQLFRVAWIFYQLAAVELMEPRPVIPTSREPIKIARGNSK
jgi:hypothetical protein